jgi:hypothetical protein
MFAHSANNRAHQEDGEEKVQAADIISYLAKEIGLVSVMMGPIPV